MRRFRQYLSQLDAEPTPVPPAETPSAVVTAQAHRIVQLEYQLADARHAASRSERRAQEAEQALRDLRAAHAGDAAATELARTRAVLRDYEDQLETCRDQHGFNTRSGAHA